MRIWEFKVSPLDNSVHIRIEMLVEERVQHLQIRSARFVQPETLFYPMWPGLGYAGISRITQTIDADFMDAEVGDMTRTNSSAKRLTDSFVYQRKEQYHLKWNGPLARALARNRRPR
jgi:hypothetical protein